MPSRKSVYKHDPATIAPLHARYLAGEDITSLAQELGITKNALLCQFHRKGLGGRVKRHWWTQSELRECQTRIERGMTLEEVSSMMGTSSHTLYRILLDAGFSAKASGAQLRRIERDKEDYRMYSMRKSEMSYSQIAAEMGWPDDISGHKRIATRISKYCFRVGIPIPVLKEVQRRDGSRRRVGYSDRVKRAMDRRAEESRRAAAESESEKRHR